MTTTEQQESYRAVGMRGAIREVAREPEACPVCGGVEEHIVGCDEQDRAR